MTKALTNQIIKSLVYGMSAEKIAEDMGVAVEEISATAETRKLEIIEERVFCQSKGAIYD